MPLSMADLSVGHRAVGSVADTIRMLAPLVIAAWMAGSSDAGVAAVPLVSVPVSPRSWSAAMAPPNLAVSATVKYCAPRSLGTTYAARPFLRAPDAAALDEDEDEEDDGPELLPDELQAARVAQATTNTEGTQRALLIEGLMYESFQSGSDEGPACPAAIRTGHSGERSCGSEG